VDTRQTARSDAAMTFDSAQPARLQGTQTAQLPLVALDSLAAVDRSSEDVGIEPIVVAELKLRDVERHIFGRHLVERADHAALEDRPETLNRIRMNGAKNTLPGVEINDIVLFHVFAAMVIDRLMIVFGQAAIDFAVIGGEQTNFVGNHFPNEGFGGFPADMLKDAGNHVALTTNCANDRSFGRRTMLTASVLTVPMLVLVLPTDERLINLDDAAQLLDIFDQSRPNLVAHEPSGFVGTEPHVTHDLQSAHALFAGEHEMGDAEPIAERLIRVLEDGPGDMREPVAVRGALFALPMPLARFQVIDLRIAAPGAMHAIGPPTGNQIGLASIFIREGRIELSGGHLRNWLRTFCHGSTPLIEPYSHNSGLLSSQGYSPL
jgi:hypothetical protein